MSHQSFPKAPSKTPYQMGGICLHMWLHVWLACSWESITSFHNPACYNFNGQLGWCKTLFLAFNRYSWRLLIDILFRFVSILKWIAHGAVVSWSTSLIATEVIGRDGSFSLFTCTYSMNGFMDLSLVQILVVVASWDSSTFWLTVPFFELATNNLLFILCSILLLHVSSAIRATGISNKSTASRAVRHRHVDWLIVLFQAGCCLRRR